MTTFAVTVIALGAGAVLFALGLTRLVTGLLRAVAVSRSGAGIVPSLIGPAAALRLGLAGIALIVLGFAWLSQTSWLVTFAAVFGLEELYETSAVLGLLRWAERHGGPFSAAAPIGGSPRLTKAAAVGSVPCAGAPWVASWEGWRTRAWL
jgi:hypothetical protein